LRNKQVVNIKLEEDWANVHIDSQPQGAEILVDGVVRGVTPLALEAFTRRSSDYGKA
jgi:hypothetical protein